MILASQGAPPTEESYELRATPPLGDGPGATAAMYLDKALEMGYNSIGINEAGVKVYNLWPNLPEANEFKMNKVLECRISTSCAYP